MHLREIRNILRILISALHQAIVRKTHREGREVLWLSGQDHCIQHIARWDTGQRRLSLQKLPQAAECCLPSTTTTTVKAGRNPQC